MFTFNLLCNCSCDTIDKQYNKFHSSVWTISVSSQSVYLFRLLYAHLMLHSIQSYRLDSCPILIWFIIFVFIFSVIYQKNPLYRSIDVTNSRLCSLVLYIGCRTAILIKIEWIKIDFCSSSMKRKNDFENNVHRNHLQQTKLHRWSQ